MCFFTHRDSDCSKWGGCISFVSEACIHTVGWACMSAVLSFGISGEFVALPGETVTRAACPERISLFGLAKLFFTPGIDVTVTVTHLMSGSRIFLTVLEVPLSTVTGDSEQSGWKQEGGVRVSSHLSPCPRWPLPLLSVALGGGSCSLGRQPVQGLRPVVTSSTLSLSAVPLGNSPCLLRPPGFVLFCFVFSPNTHPYHPCWQNPRLVRLVLHFLLLVSVCISDKSSAFCVCISLERCRLYNIKSSHQVYISSVL